jgi:3-oxoacyl-(acyl-carrier-protein) synthase III
MAIGVISIGAHTPERVVSNREIAAWANTTEQWVAERTGVLERRYAADDEATSDLAIPAARAALQAVGPAARDNLAALIVATCTPDHPQPSTAAVVQAGLGLPALPAFDVNAVCSGFLYALTIAKALLDAEPGRYALVVGADVFSRIMTVAIARRSRSSVTVRARSCSVRCRRATEFMAAPCWPTASFMTT